MRREGLNPAAVIFGLFLAFASALLGTVWVSSRCGRDFAPPAAWGTAPLRQSSSEEGPQKAPWSYQRIKRVGADDSAQYGFSAFNGDRLTISYRVPDWAVQSDENSFGYRMGTLKKIEKECAALARRGLVDCRKREANYLASHGFKIIQDHVTMADIPLLAREHAAFFRPVAKAFQAIAEKKHYDSGALLGAVTSLVQIGMIYKNAPLLRRGRQTGAVLPPAAAMAKGWGNCASKTAIAAAILMNWPQMRLIGVNPPGHYLFAVLRLPERGDRFISYKGLRYVLTEAAGPAWLPPGSVYETTAAFLDTLDGVRVEPFFKE